MLYHHTSYPFSMCHKLVAMVLNMFKKFHANFFAKICRKTVSRQLYICVSVANLSPRNLANLQFENFVTLVRMSRVSLEKSCKQLATIWR